MLYPSDACAAVQVNSRGVLTEVMRSLGVPEDKHTATCVLVDKLDKVGRKGLLGGRDPLVWNLKKRPLGAHRRKWPLGAHPRK